MKLSTRKRVCLIMTTSSFLLLIWNVHLNKEAKNSIQNQNIFSKRGNRKDKDVDSGQIFTGDPEKRNNKRQAIQRKHILEENSNQSGYVHSSVQNQQNLTNLLKKTSEEDSASRKRSSMAGTEAKDISLKSGQQQNHLIVVHDRPWFIHSTEADFSTCEYSSCRLSYNLSLLPVARAVVFDAVSLSSGPPKHRPPDQLWVLFVMEPPPRLRFHNPYFQRPEWRDVFNLTMSYRYDSDIFSPYGFVVPKNTTAKENHSLYRKAKSLVTYSSSETDDKTDNLKRDLRSDFLKKKSQVYKEVGETLFHHKHNDSTSNLDFFSKQENKRTTREEKDKRTLRHSNASETHKEFQKSKTIFQYMKNKDTPRYSTSEHRPEINDPLKTIPQDSSSEQIPQINDSLKRIPQDFSLEQIPQINDSLERIPQKPNSKPRPKINDSLKRIPQDSSSKHRPRTNDSGQRQGTFPTARRHIPESSSPSPRPEFLQMAHRKTRSAVWLVSHCQADSARDQYVRRLQRHLDVDVYGKCSGRKCGNNEECGRLINSTYRFLLAFENSFCKDYVTEKVFNAYSDDLHVIPIVRGGADYSRILPPGTYVDTSDFPSPEALATFLIGLSKDHVTYARMLERKNMYYADQWRWVWSFHWCQLCQAVQDSRSSSSSSNPTPGNSRLYPDTAHWISRHTCWSPPDLP